MSPHPDVAANPIPRELVHAEMDRIEAAEGRELLDDVAAYIRRFVMAGEAQIDTLALWIVHTHAIDAFYTTGRLYVTSPEANCGKSVVLTVLGGLVANPLNTTSISAAAMYRLMETETPTFLLDEIDKTITRSESDGTQLLLAILNGGYRRGNETIRCVGTKHEVKRFPTFAPVAMAGISTKVDQPFMSRAIPIMLTRWVGQEDLEELELDFELAEEFEALRSRINRWAGMHTEAFKRSKPPRPPGLVGRAAEIWLPLLKVAEAAGWLAQAHRACAVITLYEAPGAGTPQWELLRDLENCFYDGEDFVATAKLIERLHALEESDWSSWNRGRGLNAKTLAKYLGQYGIEATKRMKEGEQRRGYASEGKLIESWKVYVESVEENPAPIPPSSTDSGEASLFSLSPVRANGNNGSGCPSGQENEKTGREHPTNGQVPHPDFPVQLTPVPSADVPDVATYVSTDDWESF